MESGGTFFCPPEVVGEGLFGKAFKQSPEGCEGASQQI